VDLDISHQSPAFLQEHFPNILARCLEFGIDITTQPIPVVPAASVTTPPQV
jgi:L-aspartate oxidase